MGDLPPPPEGLPPPPLFRDLPPPGAYVPGETPLVLADGGAPALAPAPAAPAPKPAAAEPPKQAAAPPPAKQEPPKPTAAVAAPAPAKQEAPKPTAAPAPAKQQEPPPKSSFAPSPTASSKPADNKSSATTSSSVVSFPNSSKPSTASPSAPTAASSSPFGKTIANTTSAAKPEPKPAATAATSFHPSHSASKSPLAPSGTSSTSAATAAAAARGATLPTVKCESDEEACRWKLRFEERDEFASALIRLHLMQPRPSSTSSESEKQKAGAMRYRLLLDSLEIGAMDKMLELVFDEQRMAGRIVADCFHGERQKVGRQLEALGRTQRELATAKHALEAQTAQCAALQQELVLKAKNNNNNNNNNNKNGNKPMERAGSGISTDVAEFLKEVQLSEYAELLVSNGFNDVESIVAITNEDLVEIECPTVGDRRKILMRLKGVPSVSSGGSGSASQQQHNFDPASIHNSSYSASLPLQPFPVRNSAHQLLTDPHQHSPTAFVTSKPLAWRISGSPTTGGQQQHQQRNFLAEAFDAVQIALREDDSLLQRDWTNLRCRPTPGREVDDDQKWETKWRIACRADLVAEGQWERDAKAVMTRLGAAGRNGDPEAVRLLPMPPRTQRADNGGLVLLADQQSIGSNPSVSLPQRQRLIQRRWLGLPCP